MGLKDWVKNAPLAYFGPFQVFPDRVVQLDGFKKDERLLSGVTALVESGEALEKRVTLTRLVALGVFAFAAKKKSGGESYLLIEGPDFAWTFEVKRGDQGKAREFAGKVNNAVRQLG